MNAKQIQQQQDELIEQMRQIRSMRRGTLSRQQYAERRARKGGAGVDGPYYVWQGTAGGRHFSHRVKAQDAQRFQAGIEARLEFEALCAKYIGLGEALEEQQVREADASSDLKKTPNLPSRGTRR